MLQRKKVLFLSKWYPHRGDSQFGVFAQKHAQAIAVYADVTSIYIQSENDLASSYEILSNDLDGLHEIRVYFRKSKISFPLLGRGINFLKYILAFRKAMKRMKSEGFFPDICHANILIRPALMAFFLKLFKGVPYVVTEHWTGYKSGAFEDLPFEQKALSRFLVGKSSGTTTVSNALQNSMQGQGFNSTFYIVSNVLDSFPDSKQFEKKDTIVRIINVSDHVDWKKGITPLIRTFAAIEKEHSNIELHLIGDGPDHSLVHQAAQKTELLDEKIFLYGRQSNSFVIELMAKIDFLVVNSTIETFSVVTAEALAFGKPVIVTRCGGPEEFVREDCGLIISPNSPKELKSAMEQMILNHSSYNSEELSSYAKQKFSRESIGQQFDEIYKLVLS